MKETSVALAAFEEYALMGSARSLRKLADRLHARGREGTKETIRRRLADWSREHGWQERVRLYDENVARENRAKRQAELEKMNTEHALLGRTQALRAVKHIQDLIEAKAFGSQASVQLFKFATDLERVARGASTEQIAVTGRDGDPLLEDSTADLGDEDLKLIVELAAQLRKKNDGAT
jgi:hypothetical protein